MAPLRLEAALNKLADGRGIWRDDLRDLLDGELRGLKDTLRIEPDIRGSELRDRLRQHLISEIDQTTEPRPYGGMTTEDNRRRYLAVVKYCFNLTDNPKLREMELASRFRWLANEWKVTNRPSDSTVRRYLRGAIEQMASTISAPDYVPSLRRSLPFGPTAEPELDAQEQAQTSEAPAQSEERDHTPSAHHKKPSPLEHWLKGGRASKPVLITAGALSLALVAAITFVLLDTSAANGVFGNHASGPATVHTCAQQIGEVSTAYPSVPSTLSNFRGAPFSSSTMAVYGTSIDGRPHFIVGPNSGSCIFAESSADGATYMRVINDADNEGIFEVYVPGGIEIVSNDTCAAFPDLRSTVNDALKNNLACPVALAGGAHRITTGEEVKGLNAGLNEIGAGKGSPALEENVPASARYPTWVLDVANIGFGPVLDFKSISCTVPQGDTAVCVASFDYFLAELVNQFGYGSPNLSAAFSAIQSYVSS